VPEPLQEWAKIQSKLKEARKNVLAEEGISETGLKDLEKQVATQFDGVGQTIETAYGTVQLIYDKPITYALRKVKDDKSWNYRIKFKEKQDGE
jgi:hypothetical protein